MDKLKIGELIRNLDFIAKLALILFPISLLACSFASAMRGQPKTLACFGFAFVEFIYGLIIFSPLFLLILAIFAKFIYSWLIKKYSIKFEKPVLKIRFKSLVIFAIFAAALFWFFGFFLVFSSGARTKARDARRMHDLIGIISAQDIYYEKYSRYADSQEELVTKYLMKDVSRDPMTNIEYTDADGFGIDGGDNNSQTWGVQALLENVKPYVKEICDKSKSQPDPIPYYVCNEKGCGNLNK